MCDCHRCKKMRRMKRKSRRHEREIKMLKKLISKINIQVHIENKPKNINLNRLVNIDPDYTEANAGSGGIV